MPDHNGAVSPEIALDRYLDAVVAGLAAAPDEHLDPSLATTVQRLHALDAMPEPHPAFASSLWEDLLSVQSLSRTASPQPRLPLHIRPTPITGWRIGSSRPPSLSRFAAAIVLVLLLVGSAFVALFPLRQRDGERLPLFAPLATPTAEPESANGILLVDLTLTDIPGFPNEGGMAVTDYPPGGGSIELAGKESPEVFYIATGPMTMRVEEAVDPVRVIPPLTAGPAETERLLAAGQETILATGTTVVSPERAVVELRNDQAVPTKMIDLLWATESYSTESGLATWKRGTGMKPQDLVFPVSVVLRQLTLAPEGILPAPASADTVQAAAPLNPTQRFDLIYRADDSILNKGTQPVDLYHLTVTNNVRTVTAAPSAATPGPTGLLEFLWDSTGGPDQLVHPYGVGIDPLGKVWVSDGKNDRFQIFAPDGTFLETWGVSGAAEGQFDFFPKHGVPTYDYGDVAFDADGNIYVADTGNFRVQKFAPDRSFLLAWGSEGSEDGQLLAPGGIAVGPDGTVYVVDEGRSDVQMFDLDGTYLGVIGEAGADDGQFMSPAGVAIDADGDVWVADFGNNRIQRFSSNGDFLATWGAFGSSAGELYNPNDVAIDETGRVFVADLNNNRLQVFTPDGRFLAEIGGFGSNPGQFFTPNALAVDTRGDIYVADNERVQAFRFVPMATTLATPKP